MKRFLVCFYLFTSSFILKAQVTWDGEGLDGLWSTAENWTGNVVPGATDDVLLDNSFIGGFYTVVLPDGAITVTINSLTITPSGASSITLLLPNTNTSNPGLSVTGIGDALVLNNKAILKNSSGAPSGPGVIITNIFRINNGGKYVHNTAGGNAALVSQLSAVPGTELGEFEYDDPSGSTIISLSNRTFGTLTLSAITNGSVSYIGSGANICNIKGNLNINTGVSFAISMSADFIVAGNYNQAASSTFNLQSSSNNNFVKIRGNLASQGTITESNTGLPVLELNGSANQNISVTGAGSIINNVELRMNNATGATLLSPLTLPYNLILTSGKIKTTFTNILTMVDDASSPIGSPSSFVEGPMKKVGDDDFIFPIGEGNEYAPIGINGGGTSTDVFTAQYFRDNPKVIYGNTLSTTLEPTPLTPIDHISSLEYWTLTQLGSSSRLVTLYNRTYSNATLLTSLVVTRWNAAFSPSGRWENEGQSANSGGVSFGSITSNNLVSNFSVFTLASTDPLPTNPLPINLISFNATKLTNEKASVNWELAVCCSSAVRFEIQRANADKNFAAIGTVNGNEISRFYNYIDHGLKNGVNYYRLKMTDENGKVMYSRTVAIMNGVKGLLLTSLIPTIVDHSATLTVSSSKKQKLDLIVVDMRGRVVQKQNHTIAEGNTSIQISTANLSAGVYQLFGITDEGKTSVIRLIKQ